MGRLVWFGALSLGLNLFQLLLLSSDVKNGIVGKCAQQQKPQNIFLESDLHVEFQLAFREKHIENNFINSTLKTQIPKVMFYKSMLKISDRAQTLLFIILEYQKKTIEMNIYISGVEFLNFLIQILKMCNFINDTSDIKYRMSNILTLFKHCIWNKNYQNSHSHFEPRMSNPKMGIVFQSKYLRLKNRIIAIEFIPCLKLEWVLTFVLFELLSDKHI